MINSKDSKFNIENYSLFFKTKDKKDLNAALYVIQDHFLNFDAHEFKSKHEEKANKRFSKAMSSYNSSWKGTYDSINHIRILDDALDVLTKATRTLEEQAKTSDEIKDVLKEAERLEKEIRKEKRKAEAKLKKHLKNLGKSMIGLQRFSSSFKTNSQASDFVRDFVQQLSSMPGRFSLSEGENTIDKELDKANQKVEDSFDNKSNVNEAESKRMDDLLASISDKLTQVTSKSLRNDITEETKAIRRTKPKLIKITKQNLERLRQTKMIETDLEIISRRLEEKNLSTFTERISKIYDRLKEKMSEAKDRAQIVSSETDLIQGNVESAMREARSAAVAYEEAISENTQYDKELKTASNKKNELEQKRQQLLSERQRLSDAQGLKETGRVVIGGEERKFFEEIDNSEQIGAKSSEIRNIEDQMGRNEAKLDESRKTSLNRTVSIPERFKNMKKKLEEMSKLKEASKKLKKYKGAMGL